MSADAVEHQATVEKGLRMKIKRKTPSTNNSATTTSSASNKSSTTSSSSTISDARGGKDVEDNASSSKHAAPHRTCGGSNSSSSDDRDHDGRSSPVELNFDLPLVSKEVVPPMNSAIVVSSEDKPKKKCSSGGGSGVGRSTSNVNATSSKSGRFAEQDRSEAKSGLSRKEQNTKKNSCATSESALNDQRKKDIDGGEESGSVESRKTEAKTNVASNRRKAVAQSSTLSMEAASKEAHFSKLEKDSSAQSLSTSAGASLSCTSDSSASDVKMEENSYGEKTSDFLMSTPVSAPSELSKADGQLNAGVSTAGNSSEDMLLNSSAALVASTGTSFDPYEFVTKTEEDGLVSPMKKFKSEKIEPCVSGTSGTSVPPSDLTGMMTTICSDLAAESLGSRRVTTSDVGTGTCNTGVMTDPDCLGPCEPGSAIVLEGIVWSESSNGILVVNVTWRGKTYVGTLMDATKHHWSSPRFQDEAQLTELDWRSPKGKRSCVTPVGDLVDGRRPRKCRRAANASSSSSGPAKTCPSSPSATVSGGSEASGNGVRGSRKSRSNAELQSIHTSDDALLSRKSVTLSMEQIECDTDAANGILLECTGLNCNKKYKHINALRYHQSHAHKNERLVALDDALPVSAATGLDEKSLVVDIRAGLMMQCESSHGDEAMHVQNIEHAPLDTVERVGDFMEWSSAGQQTSRVVNQDTKRDLSARSASVCVDGMKKCSSTVEHDKSARDGQSQEMDDNRKLKSGDMLNVRFEDAGSMKELMKSDEYRSSSSSLPDVKPKSEDTTDNRQPYDDKDDITAARVSASRRGDRGNVDERSLEVKYLPQSPFRHRSSQQFVEEDEANLRLVDHYKSSAASVNRPNTLPLSDAHGATIQHQSQPGTSHPGAHRMVESGTPIEGDNSSISSRVRPSSVKAQYELGVGFGTTPFDSAVLSGLDAEMLTALHARDAAVRRNIDMLNASSSSGAAVSSSQTLLHGGGPPPPMGSGSADDYARLAAAVYGYGMDPSTAAMAAYQAHMMAAASPEYRINYERWMVDQQQRYHQHQMMAVAASQQHHQQLEGGVSVSASSAGDHGRQFNMSGRASSTNSHGSRGSSPHSRSSVHHQSSAGHRYDRDHGRVAPSTSLGQSSRSDRGGANPTIKKEKVSSDESASLSQRKESLTKHQREESDGGSSIQAGKSLLTKLTDNALALNVDRSKHSKATIGFDASATLPYSAPNLLLPSLSPSLSGKVPSSTVSHTQPHFDSLVQPYPSMYSGSLTVGSSSFDVAPVPSIPSPGFFGNAQHGKPYQDRSATEGEAGRRQGAGLVVDKSSRQSTSSPIVVGSKSSSWSKDKHSVDGSRSSLPFVSGLPPLPSDVLSMSGIDTPAPPTWNEKMTGVGVGAMGRGNPGGVGPPPGQQQSAGSPLTLRHLHTHHHTHVVQSPAGYPLYGLMPPVPAIVSPGPPPALPVPQSFVPK